MGKKKSANKLAEAAPSKSVLQNVGFAVKYCDHTEIFLYRRDVVERLESRQTDLKGMEQTLVGFWRHREVIISNHVGISMPN